MPSTLNVIAHPIGTRLVVKGRYGVWYLEETQVKVHAWTFDDASVRLEKLNGAPFFPNDENAASKLWFYANEIEVVAVLPSIEGASTIPPFTPENYPPGTELKVSFGEAPDIRKVTVGEWKRVGDKFENVALTIHRESEEHSFFSYLVKVHEILSTDQSANSKEPEKSSFDKVEAHEALLMATHPDELQKEFFKLTNRLKQIAESMGLRVDITLHV
jgi:hypothetical protein